MVSLTQLVVLFFTQAVIPAETCKKKTTVNTGQCKLGTCGWIFGNGTVASMPKAWRPNYTSSSSTASSPST